VQIGAPDDRSRSATAPASREFPARSTGAPARVALDAAEKSAQDFDPTEESDRGPKKAIRIGRATRHEHNDNREATVFPNPNPKP